MKKIIFLLAVCLFCGVTATKPLETYAYTEEEKQMAKDWLSAHGYSPTQAGAEQAYRDYLNGKFDDVDDINGGGEVKKEKESKKTEDEKTTESSTTATAAESNTTETEAKSTESTVTEESTTVAVEEATTESAEEKAKAKAVYEKAEKERNKRKWMSLGIIGVAAVVVVLGGFFLFFR